MIGIAGASTAWRLLGVAGAALCAACAASGDEPGDEACDVDAQVQAIVSGAADPGHAAVVALVGPASAPGTVCTGTVVAPRIVLTAAHCLGRLPPGGEIAIGRDVAAPDRRIAIARTLAHPDWVSPAHDLALVQLAEDPGLAPIALGTIDAASLPGSRVTLVGYGRDDDDQTGTRRSGRACVYQTIETHVRVRPDPSLSCGGDSGGPALASLDGTERIVGVASYGDPICIGAASYARLDIDLAGFVVPGMAQLADQAAQQP